VGKLLVEDFAHRQPSDYSAALAEERLYLGQRIAGVVEADEESSVRPESYCSCDVSVLVVDIGLTLSTISRMAAESVPTLPPKERLILEFLVGSGPMFGLQLVGASHGALKRGTVYVTLGRMEQKRFVESEQEARHTGAIGLPRRIYRVTPLGERALRAWSVLASELAWEVRP
jgi:DNA-binding MarR family transcriptional regulator